MVNPKSLFVFPRIQVNGALTNTLDIFLLGLPHTVESDCLVNYHTDKFRFTFENYGLPEEYIFNASENVPTICIIMLDIRTAGQSFDVPIPRSIMCLLITCNIYTCDF